MGLASLQKPSPSRANMLNFRPNFRYFKKVAVVNHIVTSHRSDLRLADRDAAKELHLIFNTSQVVDGVGGRIHISERMQGVE